MAVSVPPPVVVALGTCPAHAVQLRAGALRAAKRAVLVSLPTLAQQATPRLDLRGARVVDLRLTHRDGDIRPARPCSAIDRSVLVGILLPAERASPSIRGSPVYYVARTRHAWVIWFQAH